MGNSASSGARGHQDETVDFGRLTPQGVYTGPKDWNHAIVSQLICERRLAPFYRPLEDYEDNWDDDQILAARKALPEGEPGSSEASSLRQESTHASHNNTSKGSHSKRPALAKEAIRCPEAAIYRGATECPICFLYYPPNINHSRCCDQAICTECFVQIKRAEPTPQHIVSEPAACPYCVQDNFGVVYTPPPWRAGIGSDGSSSPQWPDSPKGSQNAIDVPKHTHKRRQKSYSHDSPEVVTTDRIRPDWEAKLAAVKATVTRRANRRIIMRQVGDRLIPVGVTSGRIHAISPEEAAQHGEHLDQGGSRRARRARNQNQDLNQLLGTMGLGGQDLEELMLMEAMRLSLQEHEEQQRREREAANREGQNSNTTEESTPAASGDGALPASPSTPAGLEGHSGSHTPATEPQQTLAPPRPDSPSNSRNRSLTPIAALRQRTPSPTPAGSSANLQPSSSKGWRRRSSSPRNFSTIAAAMNATNTATAILNTSDVPSDSSSPAGPSGNTSTPNPPSTPTPATFSESVSPPSETVSPIDMPKDASGSDAKPARPAIAVHTSSFASSLFSAESAGQSYDVLESSPDSTVSREPLLASSPDTPTIPEPSESPPTIKDAGSNVGEGSHHE